jgi:uncharacterized membrane protein YgdD (TMEM256/DUF423 family)
MNQFFLKIAIVVSALSVALGAFAAHALKNIIPAASLITFETGVRYQFYHAFAILVASTVLYKNCYQHFVVIACRFFSFGLIFFCGSLYLLAMLGPDYVFLGAITPIGGMCFIIGWILLFASIYPKNFNPKS